MRLYTLRYLSICYIKTTISTSKQSLESETEISSEYLAVDVKNPITLGSKYQKHLKTGLFPYSPVFTFLEGLFSSHSIVSSKYIKNVFLCSRNHDLKSGPFKDQTHDLNNRLVGYWESPRYSTNLPFNPNGFTI